MAKEKILVVDDEEDILELVRYNLAKEGYPVDCVATGEDALKSALREPYRLIILDLMLPGLDGLEVCKALKNDPKTATIPIIMLTAKGEESDIVTGLELGADDYVTKPFSPKVLIARIRSVFRRTKITGDDTSAAVRIRDLVIDPSRHEVTVKGKPVELTLTEFNILHFLALKPGRVYTRDQIINAVKGDNYFVTDRTVDVQIVGLRKKLGSAGMEIETIRGVGYRFKE